MRNALNFYIDGQWVPPHGDARLAVVDPATEKHLTDISMGTAEDVDRAVASAYKAFPAYSATSREERLALLLRILEVYKRRSEELAKLISREVGSPLKLSREWQVGLGQRHLEEMIRVLASYSFHERRGKSLVIREPIGVAALISPWNWPLNQIMCKVAPALAAGCTIVLKPSEVAPLNAIVLTEILAEAGVPDGVFNLINGDGPEVGRALCCHTDVSMVSITGSTRAGIDVAQTAAPTVKRVHQELGGKSANIILSDADLTSAVTRGVDACFDNSGQSCNAPTRMLVPQSRYEEALEIARRAAEAHRVGAPEAPDTTLGPLINKLQYQRVQEMIKVGLEEGAQLVTGGLGRPEGLLGGYYVKPTIFGEVTPEMRIAREEIFGPVLVVLPYQDEAHAITLANDSEFGLAAYVQSGNIERARQVALQLQVGNVYINDPDWDASAPFGGYKRSGNGREYAEWGLDAYLEIKGISGYEP